MIGMTSDDMEFDTQLTQCGRNPDQHFGAVNTPVYRASTILFPTLAALDAKEGARLRYGRRGTPTTHALEDAVCTLEQSERALVTPSGVSAISNILMSFAEPGAHFLVSDSSYGPTRKFCDFVLRGLGVETTYYDPTLGERINELIRPETKLIWMESPGSQTFEVQDVDAIVAVARAHGVVTAIDNTWSAGYFFQPMTHGVDISMQSPGIPTSCWAPSPAQKRFMIVCVKPICGLDFASAQMTPISPCVDCGPCHCGCVSTTPVGWPSQIGSRNKVR